MGIIVYDYYVLPSGTGGVTSGTGGATSVGTGGGCSGSLSIVSLFSKCGYQHSKPFIVLHIVHPY